MAEERFFFVNPSAVDGDHFTLDKTESHHFSNVLRLKRGESIWLLDGEGTGYEGIVNQNGEAVSGSILKKHSNYGESDTAVHIAVGILKRDHFELLLEKGTEIGVQSFTPLILDRCIKKSVNLDRCQKIVQSAAKQCGRSIFPKIWEPVSMDRWLDSFKSDCRVVLHWNGKRKIKDFAIDHREGPVHILVGPEGDFSEHELGTIRKTKVEFISLGNRRLRSETAAITAASFLINF